MTPLTVIIGAATFAAVTLVGVHAVSAATIRIDTAASIIGPAQAVRLNPPAAAIVNRSTCLDNGTPTFTLEIAAISYSCPVYAGGQAMIDSGSVALITETVNVRIATRPGQDGTLWIAAHRTSHGGAFQAVPNLVDGSLVTVSDGTTRATYRVVARSYVKVDATGYVIDANGNGTTLATWKFVTRNDLGGPTIAPRLALQTCDGANNRWMIYADFVEEIA